VAVASGSGEGNSGNQKKRLKALAEYVLGEGQQPYESTIGVICEAFNCTPDVAMVQDIALVRRILEARMLEQAKDQHNADNTKMTEAQTKLWMDAMESLNG